MTVKGSRTQLPLMPAEACPLYSLQRATCYPGLIAHFIMRKRADDDIKWVIVYVFLTRVRALVTTVYTIASISAKTKRMQHALPCSQPTRSQDASM